jgi:hypothetical protein
MSRGTALKIQADIDIDVADREYIIKKLNLVRAKQFNDKPHPSGVYPTLIPHDIFTGMSTIDYNEASLRGYYKIDILNMSVYSLIENYSHYEQMIKTTPNWKRLWEDTEWASKLIHVGNYTHLLKTMKPDSVPRMAAFISIIRPGKAHLQNQPWDKVFREVWDGDFSKGFCFKKSHAISYGNLVTLHMNLLEYTEKKDNEVAPGVF